MAKLYASETATFVSHQVILESVLSFLPNSLFPLLFIHHFFLTFSFGARFLSSFTIRLVFICLSAFKFLEEWVMLVICQQKDTTEMLELQKSMKEQVKFKDLSLLEGF